MDFAACQGMTPDDPDHETDIFFPTNYSPASTEAGFEICKGCKVKPDCKKWADENGIRTGIFGGQSRERVGRDMHYARVEVFGDDSDGYRWRRVDHEGNVVARSGDETFPSTRAAHHAIRVQELPPYHVVDVKGRINELVVEHEKTVGYDRPSGSQGETP